MDRKITEVNIKTSIKSLHYFFLFLEKINAFIRQNVMQMLDIFYLSSNCNVKAPTIVDSLFYTVIRIKLNDLC